MLYKKSKNAVVVGRRLIVLLKLNRIVIQGRYNGIITVTLNESTHECFDRSTYIIRHLPYLISRKIVHVRPSHCMILIVIGRTYTYLSTSTFHF